MAENARVELCFAFDAGYTLPTAMALYSALSHAATDQPFRAHLLMSGCTAETLAPFEHLATDARLSLNFIDIDAHDLQFPPEYAAHITVPTFYRLFIDDLLDVSKVLYLDGDILCTGDIAPLFHTDLEGNTIGGVRDPFAIQTRHLANKPTNPSPYHVRALENLNRVSGERDLFSLINCGVMLIDVERFRQNQIGKQCLPLLADQSYMFGDQDALNIVCAGDIKYLGAQWNSGRGNYHVPPAAAPSVKDYFQAGNTDPQIVHFPGPHKPWTAYPRAYWLESFKYDVLYRDAVWAAPFNWPGANLADDVEIQLHDAYADIAFGGPNQTGFSRANATCSTSLTSIADAHNSPLGRQHPAGQRIAYVYDFAFAQIQHSDANILLVFGNEDGLKPDTASWRNYFTKAQIDWFGPDGAVIENTVRRGGIDDLARGNVTLDASYDLVVFDGRSSATQQQEILAVTFPRLRSGGRIAISGLNVERVGRDGHVHAVRTADWLRLLFERGHIADLPHLPAGFAQYLVDHTLRFAIYPSMGGPNWGASMLCLLEKA